MAPTEEIRNAYKILVGKLEGRITWGLDSPDQDRV
jgi:hypothetical protein